MSISTLKPRIDPGWKPSQNLTKHYVDGAWVEPLGTKRFPLINPATEEQFGEIVLGDATDVDRAVAAARAAFTTFSRTTREERIAMLKRIVTEYEKRRPDVSRAITTEMGAPVMLANGPQTQSGINHLNEVIRILETYPFEEQQGTTRLLKEPIGVCGLITPWNWPIAQLATKVAPALAAGCTVVLKPSEYSPLSATVFAEAIDAAGVPKGVFNLLQGDGPGVGEAIARHPGIDMVSFTGSTRAGVQVAKAAADTVKRVQQELGGKSANIVLPDADFEKAVREGVLGVFRNSGQTCNAPTRMLVPADRLDEVAAIAKAAVETVKVGNPLADDTTVGPLSRQGQYERVQDYIQKGIDEGATLIAGGLGRPAGIDQGYFAQPTVFAGVEAAMTIAREEIFGPVLVILAYKTEDEAIELANDTPYGLAGYVQSNDVEHAQRVASRIRAGVIGVNGAMGDFKTPFGGYRQSGNGREWGIYGFEEFLETKAVWSPK
jgi:aldehyde dehydrogenase (NAD+)